MKPCLPVVSRSLLVHHDPFFKFCKGIYAELFPEKVVENNGKQESCVLTVSGVIIKLSTSRKSFAMDIKLFPMSILLENTCLLVPLMGSNFLLSMVITS